MLIRHATHTPWPLIPTTLAVPVDHSTFTLQGALLI